MTQSPIFDHLEHGVLVALANPDLASSIATILRGFKVRHVRKTQDSIKTLQALEEMRFDAMLVDAELAPEDGTMLTHKLRANENAINRALPIIMLSPPPDRAYIEKARDAGVTEFLRLPASAQVIGLRLDAALSAPRSFVIAPGYVGPDRRRRNNAINGDDRRSSQS